MALLYFSLPDPNKAIRGRSTHLSLTIYIHLTLPIHRHHLAFTKKTEQLIPPIQQGNKKTTHSKQLQPQSKHPQTSEKLIDLHFSTLTLFFAGGKQITGGQQHPGLNWLFFFSGRKERGGRRKMQWILCDCICGPQFYVSGIFAPSREQC